MNVAWREAVWQAVASMLSQVGLKASLQGEPDLRGRHAMVATARWPAQDDGPLLPRFGRTLSQAMSEPVTATRWPNAGLELRWVRGKP